MNTNPETRRGIAVGAERHQTFDEIGWRVGEGDRAPAQPVRRCFRLGAGRGADEAVIDAPERAMHRGGADAVEPRAAVLGTRRGERRPRQLLGVEALRRALWRILLLRQGPRYRL